MYAIVYGGARHADWRIIKGGKVLFGFRTKGMNPFLHDERYISNILTRNNELINHAEQIKEIYFFGSGATSVERRQIVHNAFSSFFKFAKIEISHDLHGAALACANDNPAIICVIGSGSGAIYFDGTTTIENNFGLGYLLGDEGSGNWLGKTLLKDWLYGNIPSDMLQTIQKHCDYDRTQILDRVYKQANPEQFFCSFVEILIENRESDYAKELIKKGFSDFLNLYVNPLKKRYPNAPIYFVGTVAASFQDYLRQEAKKIHIPIATITKEPIYNLVAHYIEKKSETNII